MLQSLNSTIYTIIVEFNGYNQYYTKQINKRRKGNKHTMWSLLILLENKRTAGQSDDLFGKATTSVKQMGT